MRNPRLLGVGTAVVCIAAAAGCGNRERGDASADPPHTRAIVAQARDKVRSYMRPSSGWPGPNAKVSPPAKPITLGIMPCGPYAGCLLNGKGIAQAAKALGWRTVTITPTQGTPQEVNAALLRLMDEGADAITWVGFPRAVLQPALKAAAARHIPMVSFRADDIPQSPRDVPIGSMSNPEGILGEQAAWWVIQDSGGKANVIMETNDEFTTAQRVERGFRRVLGKCPDCRVVAQADITAAAESTVAAGKTVSLLQRYPQAQYVFAPFDARAPYIVQGVRQAQRAADVKVVSSGTDTSRNLLGQRKPVFVSNSIPELWGGWATVDQLLRVMAGAPLVYHELPVMWRTSANASAPFFAPEGTRNVIDYPAEFRRLWGIGLTMP